MYVVLGSSIKAEMMGTTQASLAVIVPNFNTTLATSASDAVGYRYAKSKLTGYSGNAALMSLTNKISTAQICGVDERAVINDSDYSATVSTNPGNNESWFWDFYLQNSFDTTTLNAVVKITIHYDVKFFDPLQQGLSATRRPRIGDAGCTMTARGPLPDGVRGRESCANPLPRCCAIGDRVAPGRTETTASAVSKNVVGVCDCGNCVNNG